MGLWAIWFVVQLLMSQIRIFPIKMVIRDFINIMTTFFFFFFSFYPLIGSNENHALITTWIIRPSLPVSMWPISHLHITIKAISFAPYIIGNSKLLKKKKKKTPAKECCSITLHDKQPVLLSSYLWYISKSLGK